jgi:hypothetical protein
VIGAKEQKWMSSAISREQIPRRTGGQGNESNKRERGESTDVNADEVVGELETNAHSDQ